MKMRHLLAQIEDDLMYAEILIKLPKAISISSRWFSILKGASLSDFEKEIANEIIQRTIENKNSLTASQLMDAIGPFKNKKDLLSVVEVLINIGIIERGI